MNAITTTTIIILIVTEALSPGDHQTLCTCHHFVSDIKFILITTMNLGTPTFMTSWIFN